VITANSSSDPTATARKAAPLAGILAKTTVYPGMARVRRATDEPGRRRILGKGGSSHCYHVMSRTCGGEVVFDEVEREALVRLLFKMSRFCGVEVLTYCIMPNHFHALVRVPDRSLDDRQNVKNER